MPITQCDEVMHRVQVKTEEFARTLFKQEVAGTECLLLALLEEDDPTSKTLQANGLKKDVTTRRALTFIGVGSNAETRTVKVPYSRAVDVTLLQARAMADNRGDEYVTTAHVAIVLIRNDAAVVGELIKRLNVDSVRLIDKLSHPSVLKETLRQAHIDDVLEGVDRDLKAAAAS